MINLQNFCREDSANQWCSYMYSINLEDHSLSDFPIEMENSTKQAKKLK